jgi:hypothetical protein
MPNGKNKQPASFSAGQVDFVVYARHGREPFGSELKAEGLMGCPFDPAQGQRSLLFVNPANVLNTLAKVLAEEQVLRSRPEAGAEP